MTLSFTSLISTNCNWLWSSSYRWRNSERIQCSDECTWRFRDMPSHLESPFSKMRKLSIQSPEVNNFPFLGNRSLPLRKGKLDYWRFSPRRGTSLFQATTGASCFWKQQRSFIMHSRLLPIAKEVDLKSQCGFRPGRGCTDAISMSEWRWRDVESMD